MKKNNCFVTVYGCIVYRMLSLDSKCTIFTLNIDTPYLLSKLILEFKQDRFTLTRVKIVDEWQTVSRSVAGLQCLLMSVYPKT